MSWWENICDECKKSDPIEKWEYWNSKGQIILQGCKHFVEAKMIDDKKTLDIKTRVC